MAAEVLRPAGAARSKGLGCCPTSCLLYTSKDEVQAAADAKGESLNAYIVEAIRQRLESDMPTEDTAGEETDVYKRQKHHTSVEHGP